MFNPHFLELGMILGQDTYYLLSQRPTYVQVYFRARGENSEKGESKSRKRESVLFSEGRKGRAMAPAASLLQGRREVFEAQGQNCRMKPLVTVIESSRSGRKQGNLGELDLDALLNPVGSSYWEVS